MPSSNDRRDWSLDEVQDLALSTLRTFPQNARFWRGNHWWPLSQLIVEKVAENKRMTDWDGPKPGGLASRANPYVRDDNG